MLIVLYIFNTGNKYSNTKQLFWYFKSFWIYLSMFCYAQTLICLLCLNILAFYLMMKVCWLYVILSASWTQSNCIICSNTIKQSKISCKLSLKHKNLLEAISVSWSILKIWRLFKIKWKDSTKNLCIHFYNTIDLASNHIKITINM